MNVSTVYRFYDDRGRLLYVGCTSDAGRFDQHRRVTLWFDQAARITLEHFDTKREALQAEYNAIQTERPKYNVNGSLSPAAPKRALQALRTNARPQLTDARRRAGLSKAELGRLVGATGQTIYRWECGERNPSAEAAQRLTEVLHIRIELVA